ncbi:MAG: GNAT family N-acetyltransferase [Clostridia bacterium]|nr:GNAT family N-acetyltransferase [Clostridia bacterium]
MNITRLEKKDFESFFALMQEAFPTEEYRPKEKQYGILDDANYSAYVLKEGNDVNAFIATWRLNGFYFAEHLAVSKVLRNQGVGSAFVKKYLELINIPLVLEVENLTDSIAQRRIGFYERLGFVLTDICYDQPNFQESSKRIPLRIMYHKNGQKFDIKTIKQEIFEKVYKKPID